MKIQYNEKECRTNQKEARARTLIEPPPISQRKYSLLHSIHPTQRCDHHLLHHRRRQKGHQCRGHHGQRGHAGGRAGVRRRSRGRGRRREVLRRRRGEEDGHGQEQHGDAWSHDDLAL
ncbi:hypothetical protein VPH35_128641 [Triticum aestivum]